MAFAIFDARNCQSPCHLSAALGRSLNANSGEQKLAPTKPQGWLIPARVTTCAGHARKKPDLVGVCEGKQNAMTYIVPMTCLSLLQVHRACRSPSTLSFIQYHSTFIQCTVPQRHSCGFVWSWWSHERQSEPHYLRSYTIVASVSSEQILSTLKYPIPPERPPK